MRYTQHGEPNNLKFVGRKKPNGQKQDCELRSRLCTKEGDET